MGERALCGGQVIDSKSPCIPADDPGWRFGETLFETIPLYEGEPYLLEEHWRRLSLTAAALGVEVPLDSKELREAIRALRPDHERGMALLRWTVSFSGAWSLTGRRPSVEEDAYRRGWPVILFPPFLNNRTGFWGEAKSGNYAGVMLSRKLLKERGGQEGIFVTEQGELLEGSFTSLFLGKGEALLTPWMPSRILPGVTRQRLLEVLRGRCEIREARLSLLDLWEAEEGFLCGSGAEIIPIRTVEGRLLPSGAPGPLTLRAMKRFARDVKEKTGKDSTVARVLADC